MSYLASVFECTNSFLSIYKNRENTNRLWDTLKNNCEEIHRRLKDEKKDEELDILINKMFVCIKKIIKENDEHDDIKKILHDPDEAKKRAGVFSLFVKLEYTCPICYECDDSKKFLFAPCSHFICENCASKLRKPRCPMCNANMETCIQYEKHGDNLKYSFQKMNDIPETPPLSPMVEGDLLGFDSEPEQDHQPIMIPDHQSLTVPDPQPPTVPEVSPESQNVSQSTGTGSEQQLPRTNIIILPMGETVSFNTFGDQFYTRYSQNGNVSTNTTNTNTTTSSNMYYNQEQEFVRPNEQDSNQRRPDTPYHYLDPNSDIENVPTRHSHRFTFEIPPQQSRRLTFEIPMNQQRRLTLEIPREQNRPTIVGPRREQERQQARTVSETPRQEQENIPSSQRQQQEQQRNVTTRESTTTRRRNRNNSRRLTRHALRSVRIRAFIENDYNVL